jgi:integral membrane sensor domain MASE1
MLIWPAGGIGLAAFLLNPRRLWPALTLAFYIAGILADVFLANRIFLSAVGYMTGNMVKSIRCAWFISYVSPDFQIFTRVKEILALSIGAILINAFSAFIGAGSSLLINGDSFSESWRNWFVADELGILLVCPFIICWISYYKSSFVGLHPKKVIEFILFILIWTLICYVLFYHLNPSVFFVFRPYMMVALISWPAVRFGMKGVTLATLTSFLIVIISSIITSLNSPWFETNNDFSLFLIHFQIFLMFLTFLGYLLSAFYSGLKRTEVFLRKS